MTGGVPKRPENRAIGGVVNVPGLHQPDRVAMRLDALTSLRFFAAALIVLHHSRESFSIGQGWEGVRFGQGVSFFFVLSGFILCYVYPRLGSPAAIGEFLRARIARIWPAHVLGFLVAVILLSVPLTPTAFLNLAMVHSWVPSLQTYFSYNAPSWSIATEFCFYLLFPILIRDFSRTWWWKFGLSLAIVLALAKLAGLLGVPRLAEEGLTVHWLLYINPLARRQQYP